MTPFSLIMKYFIIIALMLLSSLVFANCTNTKNGALKIHRGTITCDLKIQEPIKDRRIRFLVQAVKVEATLKYDILSLFAQLANHPNEISLPALSGFKVSLIMGDKTLPIDMDMQPTYKIKSNGSVCSLTVIGFEPRVSNLKSKYLPSWLAKTLEDYINQDVKLKKDVLSKARKALPKIKSYVKCQ